MKLKHLASAHAGRILRHSRQYLTLLSLLAGFNSAGVAAEFRNLDVAAVRDCGSNQALAIEQAEMALQNLANAGANADTQARAQATEKLGTLYWQSRQLVLAKQKLELAFDLSQDLQQKYRLALLLGNTHASLTLMKSAQQWWQKARDLASDDESALIAIELNQIRASYRNQGKPAGSQLSKQKFLELRQRLNKLAHAEPNLTAALNLSIHLFELAQAEAGMQSELREWGEDLLALSKQQTSVEAQLQILMLLAKLAQQQDRSQQALALLAQAGYLAASQAGLSYQQLLLERQRAALYQQQQQAAAAIMSYQRAITYLEQIRADLPLLDEYGQSLHQTLIQPVYQAYVDLLLTQAKQQAPDLASQTLYQVRELMEASKRSELQDYLGERCSIEQAQQAYTVPNKQVRQGVAVIYPIVLADRIEILLETSAGIQSYTVAVNTRTIQQLTNEWVSALRSGDASAPQHDHARQLWQWLIAPIQANLQALAVQQLVIIPDAVLRLIPYAALYNGKNYLVQDFQLSISPALNLLKDPVLNQSEHNQTANLLAGMSTPGAVVDKLPENLVQQLLLASTVRGNARGAQLQRGLRGFNGAAANLAVPTDIAKANTQTRSAQLQAALALQGVTEEIAQLQSIFGRRQTTLLDQEFTATAFAKRVAQADFTTIHIASHGVFGGDAEHTFIMAYDDVINLRQLQKMLRQSHSHKTIDLITLSACETAEGDERAPLGLSGAALQANARSALGSLWSVSDQATSLLMQEFYRARAQGKNKAEALRQAQLSLLEQAEFQQPFYWAAFILVGSYL